METPPAPERGERPIAWYTLAQLTSVYARLLEHLAEPVEASQGAARTRGPRAWLLDQDTRSRWAAVLALLLAIGSLWSAWYSGSTDDWMFFWTMAGIAVLFSGSHLAGVRWAARRGEWRLRQHPEQSETPTLPATAQAIRAAALAGDDTLAPLAAPRPTTTAPLPATLRVAPADWLLLRPKRFAGGFWAGYAGFWCLMLGAGLWTGSASLPSWQMLVLWPLLFVGGAASLISMNWLRRPVTVEVTEQGLRWQVAWRPPEILDWAETRSFIALSLASRSATAALAPRTTVYLLTGMRTSVVWIGQGSQPADLQQAGWTLAALVAAHASVPLRDVSASANALAESAAQHVSFARTMGLPTDTSHLDSPEATETRRSLRVARWTFAAALPLVLIGALVALAQPGIYKAQLARAESGGLLLSDPLTAPTLTWIPLPHTATKDFSFTPAGYQVESGGCCDLSSLLPGTVGDGLFEVTAEQRTDFHLSEAGLAFRSSSAPQYVLVWTVNPDGEWLLTRFDVQADGSLGGQHELRRDGIFFGVGAIHRGLHATNRLAVLMRGTTYTFFINGQFVGSYWGSELGPTRQIGVYADTLSQAVIFSRLRLYVASR